MRRSSFTIHNNQVLEVFVKQRSTSAFLSEVWLVSTLQEQRVVLDHFVTAQDWERTISYATVGDMTWQNGDEADIPDQKTEIACSREELIARGTESDIALSCYNAALELPFDRKEGFRAKKALFGRWTDGTATLNFEPNCHFHAAFPPDALHPRFVRVAAERQEADWWKLSCWWLFLMNSARGEGQKIGLWRCDREELHIVSDRKDVLVHAFHHSV